MKRTRQLFVLLLVCPLYTCCTDEPLLQEGDREEYTLKSLISPINNDNPADSLGTIYSNYYDYLEIESQGKMIVSEAFGRVSNEIPELTFTTTGAEISEYATIGGTIIDGIGQLLQVSSLNSKFIDYFSGVENLSLSDADYNSFYSYSLYWESTIEDMAIPQQDKETLYRVTAMFRFQTDKKRKKRKHDRDWELTVGSAIALIEQGSETSDNLVATALMMDLVN